MRDGLLMDVIKMMGAVGSEEGEFERLTILMFDEMKVENVLEFDQREDEVVGPFSQMQVVMAKGLCGSWKQPVISSF